VSARYIFPPVSDSGEPIFSDLPRVDGVEHRAVTLGGFRIHYAEAGEGEPLVLLHGWPQHWYEWRYLIGPLAERYRVIAPDIRGLGWSQGPGSSGRMWHYSLRALAAELIGLLDALGIGQTRYVGHDWGCVIGYRALLSYPHRFHRASLLGGVHPWASFAPLRLYLRPWHLYAYALLGASATWRLGVVEHCLRSWRHHGEFSEAEEKTFVDRASTRAAVGATRAYDRNIVVNEIPHFLRHHRSLRLRVPVLHINGAEDPLTRAVPGRSWRRYADDMRLELLPDCGHFIAEERPQELLDRLNSFMAAGPSTSDAGRKRVAAVS
jgi:pimeloyl-ACP methyl ester carboxylesterase